MPSEKKSTGATFTPKILADFVASNIVKESKNILLHDNIKILEPAIGEGELISSLLSLLDENQLKSVEVFGFDINNKSLELAKLRLKKEYPLLKNVILKNEDYLQHFLENSSGLFQEKFDIIIANPPYVRTQIMGSKASKELSLRFNLTGRTDLYQAFIVAMLESLSPDGTMGVIASNRFMSVKNGETVRRAFVEKSQLINVWDLGDTKIFDAAILPAVVITKGPGAPLTQPSLTSIYETNESATNLADNQIDALNYIGNVQVNQITYKVQKGNLDTSGDHWILSNSEVDEWLERVQSKTWKEFKDIGKIRVGIKTCADKVFIRNDWDTFASDDLPELVRPLTTHFIARRFKADSSKHDYRVLYPHAIENGKRKSVDLSIYPKSEKYLIDHKVSLQGRKYLAEAGRNWYEIWVPQDPSLWKKKKLVFRDIAKEPTFWLDDTGSIINGDCYWMIAEDSKDEELLWLAMAIANSPFIEKFYDVKFNNKLYAGRRRFITQYVEKFPLPDPSLENSKRIIQLSKDIYNAVGSDNYQSIKSELDALVWHSFS